MMECEIEHCLSTHPKTKRVFRGVYALDELPQRHQDGIYIVNTDTRQEPGSHWLLCYFTATNRPFYFDSYGLPPLYPELYAFLNNVFEYNKQQIQGINSSVCGHYVTYIATQLGHPFPELRKKLFSPTNFERNDQRICTLFRQEFGYPRYIINSGKTLSCHSL